MTSKLVVVKVLSDTNIDGFIHQSPNSLGEYGDVKFVFDDRTECDYVVVINQVLKKTNVFCNPQNIWALMMEPPIDGFFDFTRFGHERYGRVFISKKTTDHFRYVNSHIMTPWHMGMSYDEILNYEIGKKEKPLSCISSNKSFLPGHKKRIDFVEKLKKTDLEIDFFGRGSNPIEDKWQALYSYKYSIAIENSSSYNYWTEKLSDCFMAYTIPIYYGCTNISDYFPQGAILKIDINDFEGSKRVISEALQGDYYEKNFDALIEARKLYLKDYHFFPCIAKHIIKDIQDSKDNHKHKQEVEILPLKRSLWMRFKNLYKRKSIK
jgi:hypothetical protein